MQRCTAGDLHREMLHAQHTPGSLPADGKSIRQQIIQGLALGQPLLEQRSLALQLCIRHSLVFILQGQHLLGQGGDLFQLPIRKAAKEFFNKGHR